MVRKTQSAMEYLMTYGWAILAIAIVMVSLYSLGIFNTGSLQPTATPGSCEVVRTVAQTSLAGQCSNLIPKYVGQFNGNNSWINIPNSESLQEMTGQVTFVIWFNTNSLTSAYGLMSQTGYPYIDFYLSGNNKLRYELFTASGYGAQFYSSSLGTSKWYQAVMSYNGTTMVGYLNGVAQGSGNPGGPSIAPDTHPIILGNFAGFFSGLASNVQVYNTSLDQASVTALYQEGIGGAPIDVHHIIGWWPLNGNANDYSGNNNQGTATSMIWNANWQSGYTAPTS